ncbi:hypothetical protein [Micromonospora arida]|uniref:Uncharacterized protein n=1 Tax=Micromonospora arida TaxID=2203715 RepID=A0A3N9X4G9_9ACTN|nr:hypothetical protein [Micromonospora arida]RQX07882.1 hypothetical protein DLJ58_20235 [Micromonospora arida]
MSFNLSDSCLWCIEQNTPTGVLDILGPVFRPCPVCLPVCGICEGDGLFPADFTCIPCFLNRLAALGIRPLFCVGCSGVTDLEELGTVPEVTPHGHH